MTASGDWKDREPSLSASSCRPEKLEGAIVVCCRPESGSRRGRGLAAVANCSLRAGSLTVGGVLRRLAGGGALHCTFSKQPQPQDPPQDELQTH